MVVLTPPEPDPPPLPLLEPVVGAPPELPELPLDPAEPSSPLELGAPDELPELLEPPTTPLELPASVPPEDELLAPPLLEPLLELADGVPDELPDAPSGAGPASPGMSDDAFPPQLANSKIATHALDFRCFMQSLLFIRLCPVAPSLQIQRKGDFFAVDPCRVIHAGIFQRNV